jgi:hypothetical protein
MVDDQARSGVLRFAKEAGGSFLRADGVNRIPPVVKLPQLLAAAEHFEEESDNEEDLRLLLASVLQDSLLLPNGSLRPRAAK